nr:hypothetical protein [uncultured Celeribacter sp.]
MQKVPPASRPKSSETAEFSYKTCENFARLCVFWGPITSRHSFDPEIAGRVGLNAAVIFQNIAFWIEKNQANRHNLRDGRYWTYNSISAFGELFSSI